jgi:hypothetical protein
VARSQFKPATPSGLLACLPFSDPNGYFYTGQSSSLTDLGRIAWRLVNTYLVLSLHYGSAGGLGFLRCPAFLKYEGASLPSAFRSIETHVDHHRIKIEWVYRPYLTAQLKRRASTDTSPPCY